MSRVEPVRAHVVVGAFPPGASGGHDMDYARFRILELLQQQGAVQASVANDYSNIEKWLAGRQLLISYCAGPYLDDAQNEFVQRWLSEGGRWLALHGSSGGKAARLPGGGRRMEKARHHETLGSLFIHHPPIRKFTVDVVDRDHPLTRGLEASFDVMDELYFLDLHDPSECHFLLTTNLPKDPTPAGFTWVEYDEKKSLLPDGKSRPLGYTKELGKGGVAYIALGHCHSPSTSGQPSVDTSVARAGETPPLFRGAWETDAFGTLLKNGIAWGLDA